MSEKDTLKPGTAIKRTRSYKETFQAGLSDVAGNKDDLPGNWPLFTITITLLQISLFIYFYVTSPTQSINTFNSSTRCGPFILSPYHQAQIWRLFLYQFNHAGIGHLASNCLLQLVIGTLLEFVHGSWRIALIYTMGVITGALFSMPLSPFNFLVGASGGDYALIAACIANLVLNWDSMDSLLAKYGRLSLIVCWAVMDIGLLIHRNITQKPTSTSWQAHCGGALAGVCLGVAFLYNIDRKPWEQKVKWIGLALYCLLLASLMVIWIVLPAMKSNRQAAVQCFYFPGCKQVDPEFDCVYSNRNATT